MNEGKYRINLKNKYLKRTKANEYIREQLSDHQCLFLQGIAGSGKTVTIFSLIKEFYQSRYIYYRLDQRDNNLNLFIDHFKEAFLAASLKCNILETKEISLEALDKPYLLVLDQFEEITNIEIIEFIKYLITYIPEKLLIIFISQTSIPKSWYPLIQYNHLHIIEKCPFFFDKNETIKLGKMLHIKKIDPYKIYQDTNGWPVIVNYLFQYDTLINDDNYILFEFFDHIKLTDSQLHILKIIALTPYATINLLKSLQLPNIIQDITYLINVSLINLSNQTLTLIPVYKQYLRQKYQESFYSILETVYSYYQDNRFISDLLFCYNYLKPQELLSFVQKYDFEIGKICSLEQLEIINNILDKDSNDIHVLYLKGIMMFMLSDDQYQMIVDYFEKMYQQSSNREIKIRLLNLLFLSNCHDIKRIITLKTSKEEFDSVIGNYPSCLNGKRDLTNILDFKYKNKSEYDQYISLFSTTEQQYIKLAEVEHLLYLNKTQKCLEEIEYFLHIKKEKLPIDIVAGLASILFKLYYLLGLKDSALRFYHEYRKVIGSQRNYIQLNKNLNLHDTYCSCLINDKEAAYDWYRIEKKDEDINNDNYYNIYILARVHYIMERYDQANYYFTKLEGFFRKEKRILYLCECLFANGVCLYALNNQTRALTRVTEAFTVAGQYRYVFPFITYGKYGLELMKMYRKLIKEDVLAKKSYENTLITKSYNQYLKTIIKECERMIKTYPSIEKTNNEQLTVKETAVLKCIEKGYTNKEISEELVISMPTVKTHVSNIFSKLGVKNRTQAINYVKENRLFEK